MRMRKEVEEGKEKQDKAKKETGSLENLVSLGLLGVDVKGGKKGKDV